jgi:hypothetical protein
MICRLNPATEYYDEFEQMKDLISLLRNEGNENDDPRTKRGFLTALSLAAGKCVIVARNFRMRDPSCLKAKERWMEGLEAVKCGAATV